MEFFGLGVNFESLETLESPFWVAGDGNCLFNLGNFCVPNHLFHLECLLEPGTEVP